MRRNLTKIEILRKKGDINSVFQKGKAINSFGMRIIYLNNDLGYDRLVVIPVKHFGRAVDRNLVRRRAKEIFRNYEGRHIPGSENKDSKDYVLVVYPGKVSDFALLESGFVNLLDRSNQK